MELKINHVLKNITEIINSIELLMEKSLTGPALILTYSAIDIVSSLSVMGDKDSQRSDFIKWVEEYLLSSLNTPCTGKDLYAARCSVVHIFGSESLLSRKGEAKNVIYVWGDKEPDEWQRNVNLLEEGQFIVIKIEDLIYAFREATAQFFEAIQEDERLKENIKIRAQKMLSSVE
ncbi:hypothetical protein CPY53_24185 [Paenibacillus polymyxa]|uniref:hypothetical protein n=1 Tax=Paenibacillus polymyxa TaxID=1406 RepID=UPI001F581AB5|nr:hypothetical protein [Paenibacillus polymyxa]UNL96460.1 hypothetical protein CPY53_24185 [Paenibacillus polymyxa]